jgi:acyl-CoA dehydrogenase
MQARSPYYTEEHETFREQVRRFVAKEMAPHINRGEEEGAFPRELYVKAANAGLLQVGFPEAYGGIPVDRFFSIILQQELARCGSGGVVASLVNHTIAMPALVHGADEAIKQVVVPQVLSGEKILALACTEPTGGSDVASARTTARLEGDHYLIKGEKTFISSGMRADYFVVVARTGGPGMKGLSLLLVNGDAEGLARTPLKKMGWLPSDTATLYFDNVRVPRSHLIGPENAGFALLAANFNDERINVAATAIAYAEVAYQEALAWAHERETFGKPIFEHQVIRHKLVDMAQRIAASQAYLELTAWRMEQGHSVVADVCLVKNQATQTMAFCASEAVQIFGAMGYLRGNVAERIYREVKVLAIGGGTEEILKELASKHLPAWRGVFDKA